MTEIIANLLVLLAVCYGCVLLAVVLDLVVALRRLRRSGKQCTSRGLRRTVAKLSGYFASLMSLTLVDAMLVAASLCMEACGGKAFMTPFPYLSMLGAVSLAMIELKSVSETTGVSLDLPALADLLGRLLRRR